MNHRVPMQCVIGVANIARPQFATCGFERAWRLQRTPVAAADANQ